MKTLSKKETEELLNLSLINNNIASFNVINSHMTINLKDGRRIEISSSNDGEQFTDLFE